MSWKLLSLFAVLALVALTLWSFREGGFRLPFPEPGSGNPQAPAVDQKDGSPFRVPVEKGVAVAATEVRLRVVRDGQPVAGAKILGDRPADGTRFYELVKDRFVRSNFGPAAYWSSEPGALGAVLGTSDAEGVFRLPRTADPVALTARTGAGVSETLVFARWDGVPDEVVMELGSPRTLEVRVVDGATELPVVAENRCFLALPDLSTGTRVERFVLVHEGQESQFAVPDLRAGRRLTLVSTHSGYAPARVGVVVEGAPARCRIELEGVEHVAGRVTDVGGKAISGAVVVGRRGGFHPPTRCRTDGEGRYRLSLPNGTMRVAVSSAAFLSQTREGVSTGDGDVDFVLERAAGARVAGRVLSDVGDPVIGARMELWQTDREGIQKQMNLLRKGEPFLAVETRRDGSFEFEFVARGAYALDVLPAAESGAEAAAGGFIQLRHKAVDEILVTADRAPEFQELRLPAFGRIEVTLSAEAVRSMLHDKSSTSLPYVLLKQVVPGESRPVPLTQLEIVAGRGAVFAGLPAGDYLLNTFPASFVKQVKLAAGQTARVVEGEPGLTVEGQVFRDGLPLARCGITAGGQPDMVRLARSRSQGDGSFALLGLGVGNHLFHLRDRDGRTTFLQGFVAEGRPLRLDWPTGSLDLSIDPKHGECVVRVDAETVDGVALPPRLPKSLRVVHTGRVDATRTQNVAGLAPGRYSVTLLGPEDKLLAETAVQVPQTGAARVEL